MHIKAPLRLYIHIPFCAHKCHYCDFNSHVRQQIPWQTYTESLLSELTYWAKQTQFHGRVLHSIFIGGGTPSLAPASVIDDILTAVRQQFDCISNIEITLEANPGSAEAERFAAYHATGINRLSIGIQSVEKQQLQWLERIHSADEAMRAFAMARQAGFNNINLDLMYGLPQQNKRQWQHNLEKLLALQPEHLSCYQLTVEPHTRLASQHAQTPYALPSEKTALELFMQTRQTLQTHAYHAYEISNFAKSTYHCQHNDGYWQYDDYIGIGAGASGKWDMHDGSVYRYSNIRNPEHYSQTAQQYGAAINSDEQLSLQHAAAEALWLGLRRSDGIDISTFEHRFQMPLSDVLYPAFERWLTSEHLLLDNKKLYLSPSGIPLADTIAASAL